MRMRMRKPEAATLGSACDYYSSATAHTFSTAHFRRRKSQAGKCQRRTNSQYDSGVRHLAGALFKFLALPLAVANELVMLPMWRLAGRLWSDVRDDVGWI